MTNINQHKASAEQQKLWQVDVELARLDESHTLFPSLPLPNVEMMRSYSKFEKQS